MTASFGQNPTPLFGILNMIILNLSITWVRFAKIRHDIGSRLEASRSRGHNRFLIQLGAGLFYLLFLPQSPLVCPKTGPLERWTLLIFN